MLWVLWVVLIAGILALIAFYVLLFNIVIAFKRCVENKLPRLFDYYIPVTKPVTLHPPKRQKQITNHKSRQKPVRIHYDPYCGHYDIISLEGLKDRVARQNAIEDKKRQQDDYPFLDNI